MDFSFRCLVVVCCGLIVISSGLFSLCDHEPYAYVLRFWLLPEHQIILKKSKGHKTKGLNGRGEISNPKIPANIEFIYST